MRQDSITIVTPENKDAGDQLSASLHQVLLFGFILDVGKDRDIAGQFPDFGKGFNDHQGGLNRLRAFKTSCKTF